MALLDILAIINKKNQDWYHFIHAKTTKIDAINKTKRSTYLYLKYLQSKYKNYYVQVFITAIVEINYKLPKFIFLINIY